MSMAVILSSGKQSEPDCMTDLCSCETPCSCGSYQQQCKLHRQLLLHMSICEQSGLHWQAFVTDASSPRELAQAMRGCAEWQRMLINKCECIQSYLFSRPGLAAGPPRLLPECCCLGWAVTLPWQACSAACLALATSKPRPGGNSRWFASGCCCCAAATALAPGSPPNTTAEVSLAEERSGLAHPLPAGVSRPSEPFLSTRAAPSLAWKWLRSTRAVLRLP